VKHEIAIIAYYTDIFISAFLNKVQYYFFFVYYRVSFLRISSYNIKLLHWDLDIYLVWNSRKLSATTSYKRLSCSMMSRYQTLCRGLWCRWVQCLSRLWYLYYDVYHFYEVIEYNVCEVIAYNVCHVGGGGKFLPLYFNTTTASVQLFGK